MAWSTRQLADLAGTSLRAVRHYHQVGLLPEPERRSNGYKQYGVSHLVRLLRIKRLVDLGFSLPQIADMGDADEHPEAALKALDAELASTIERLRGVRTELATIIREEAPTDMPADLHAAASRSDLSEADRNLVVVMSRIAGPAGLQAYREMLASMEPDPNADAFDTLPADADEQTRAELAEHVAEYLRDLYTRHPGIREVHADAPGGSTNAKRTMGLAMRELYNEAQLDVMVRVATLMAKQPETA